MSKISVDFYDQEIDFQTDMLSMITPRFCHIMTKVGNFLVVTGGWQNISIRQQTQNVNSNCEKYDMKVGMWSEAGKMIHSRIKHSACSFGEELMYVVGGTPGLDKKAIS